jgi:UPF0755 protein
MAKRKKSKKKSSMIKKTIIAFLIIVLIGSVVSLYKLYEAAYQPNIVIKEGKSTFLYIPSGSKFEDVKKILYDNKFIKNKTTFEWIAERKKYKNHILPGKYQISTDMSNNDLVNLLRSGKQTPVKLSFINLRTKEQLAGRIAKQIETDSLTLINFMNNEGFLNEFGVNPNTVLTLFIPNTYEIMWNTDGNSFFVKINKESKKFWNNERKTKAEMLNLKPSEIYIIASIIQQETNRTEEMSRVAGVYVNRLKKGMLLQADPTVKFAVGDFSIRRILNKHLKIDSPYNTYKYEGLPPGPICIANSVSIDKVLNLEKHNYIYFCARPDGSGLHNFAVTKAEHERNAKNYHQMLNMRNIKK